MRQPMLAATIEDKDLEKLPFPLDLSIKLDGIRSVIRGGQALSRSMKLIPNRFVQEFFSRHLRLDGMDGELMVGDNFQSVTSAIMSRDGKPHFSYHVFDRWDMPEIPFEQRIITNKHIEAPRVVIVRQTRVYNLDQFIAYEEAALAANHEGIMARVIDGPYKYGRSTLKQGYLMKRKPFDDDEAIIVGFEEAEQNTNEAFTSEVGRTKRSTHKAGMVGKGTLGVILAEHPTFGTIRIGGGQGWTDALRADIWANQPKYMGLIIKFKYQRVGTVDKPRSGQYMGFRSPLDM